MENLQLNEILRQLGISVSPDAVHPFQNEEGSDYYNVWKIEDGDKILVLKEAKGYELDTYRAFFSEETAYAPRLLGTAQAGEKDYFLMAYIPGENLCHCDRNRLTMVLDSLIAMQKTWWNHPEPETGYLFSRSLSGRENRMHYLRDPQLEAAYDVFLKEYIAVPRTLCHDDLLPFNVLCTENRAVFIDWEYGGILPYPVSLVRLIAHGEESEGAFFFMTDADKDYAVRYYYDHFIQKMGIPYDKYLKTLRLFLFYEYCEWVYVGNKYEDTSTTRFQSYFKKAKQLALELGF